MKIFHDIDSLFDAKLRYYTVEIQKSIMREGEAVFHEGIAYIDALFNLEIFDYLHQPSLIGIERVLPNGDNVYILFETLTVKPRHYETASLTPEIPPVLKWEYLEKIEESWRSGGENWMEIVAVHTGYTLKVKDNSLKFTRSFLSPLIGSRAHIMSDEIIKSMVCIEDGSKVGVMKGFNIDLTIDIYSIYRYHTGVFGFTGTGKSNLVSLIVRKIVEREPNIKVVIFDIAGEYTVHLLDLIRLHNGVVYIVENIPRERFIETQVIPETLLEYIDENIIRAEIAKVNIKRLYLETLEVKIADLKAVLREASTKGIAAKSLVARAMNILDNYPDEMLLSEFMNSGEYAEARNNLIRLLSDLKSKLHEKATARRDLDYIISSIHGFEISNEISTHSGISIDKLAEDIVKDRGAPAINIIYTPNPIDARISVSKLVNRIFAVKKNWGLGNKILMVFDEAQEFIPDRTRSEDYTLQSNIAVETVLRQGRKYFIGGIIATQRLAHLNTNALQQLHSYFVSTLPRTYDRNVISDAFSISRSIVDKTLELDVGEWIFVSYKATKLKNVPVEIKAENNEEYLIRYFKEIAR